ncbi:MAG: LruC domain-containing protein [Bacteroidales bacterium]|jgi:hypothetical protein|nr:LruC domain-containing protein [Bacteroidales bacterium]
MKKLLYLFIGVFALASCSVKDDTDQNTRDASKFSLSEEITVNVKTATDGALCYLYVGNPYEDGHIAKEPVLTAQAPFNVKVRIPKSTETLYLMCNGEMKTFPKGNIKVSETAKKDGYVLTDALKTAVNNLYPEGDHSIYDPPKYTLSSDLVIGDSATEVWITFVGTGGSTYDNALYYYVYTDTTDVIEPIALEGFEGNQNVGSTVKLPGVFQNCKIGFACRCVSPGGSQFDYLKYSTPHYNMLYNNQYVSSGVMRTLNYQGNVYQTLGMEDQLPGEWFDQDYNDLLCLIESTPVATPENPIDPPTIDPGKVVWQGMWLFEDNYPEEGDYDFNDVVVKFRIETPVEPEKTEAIAYLEVAAIGAGFHNNFGINGKTYLEDLTGFVNVHADEDKVPTQVIQFPIPKATRYVPMLNNGYATFNLDTYNDNNLRFPNVFEIPDANYKWCLESIRIDSAYTRYNDWVNSGCTTNTDWYTGPRNDNMVFMK